MQINPCDFLFIMLDFCNIIVRLARESSQQFPNVFFLGNRNWGFLVFVPGIHVRALFNEKTSYAGIPH